DRVAEALLHDLLERYALRRDPASGAETVSSVLPGSIGLDAIGEGLGTIQNHPAEADDGGIGGRQVLAGAVDDRALALLDHRILLGDAADTGIGVVLLVGTIEQIVVAPVA